MTRAYNHDVFAQTVRGALEKKGWSQAELGRRIGVAQQSVNKWMAGETRPSPRRLGQIEEALDLDPGSLIVMVGYAAPNQTITRYTPAAKSADLPDKISRLAPEDRQMIERLVDRVLGEE